MLKNPKGSPLSARHFGPIFFGFSGTVEENTRHSEVLAEIAFYMLHGNMQANFIQHMENSGSLHGNIL